MRENQREAKPGHANATTHTIAVRPASTTINEALLSGAVDRSIPNQSYTVALRKAPNEELPASQSFQAEIAARWGTLQS
jgi:hypothetical protein